MAFKQYSKKEEIIDVIYSVDDTLLVLDENYDRFIEDLYDLGFKNTKDNHFSILHKDNKIDIVLKEVPGQEGKNFINCKSFYYSLSEGCYVFGRSNDEPSYIFYHPNGKKHLEKWNYRFQDKERVHGPLQIETTERKRVTYYPKKDFFIYHVVETKNEIEYFYSYKKKKLPLAKIVAFYPHVSNFTHDELIHLDRSLSKEEHQLLEILFY